MATLLVLALTCLATSTNGHAIFLGQCPPIPPVQDFSWPEFSEGLWFVTHKFSTSSSCLTYNFKTDSLGFKSIEQVRHLPYVGKVGLDHEYIYTGNLYAPSDSTPAKMVVKFPLNPVGAAAFVVLAANSTSHALTCTCQTVDLLLTFTHRTSCSILQRAREEDTDVTTAMKALVNEALGEDASHDFDAIDQSNCPDPDRSSALNIDVDRLLGRKVEEYDEVYGDYEANTSPL